MVPVLWGGWDAISPYYFQIGQFFQSVENPIEYKGISG